MKNTEKHMTDMSNVSALMSVYSGDSPNDIQKAVSSLYSQTSQPAEIVIVRDGPVSEKIENLLTELESGVNSIVKVIRKRNNRGLGFALNIGLQECKCEFVARIDSDDIAVPDRIEKQRSFLNENDDISVVGGYICEKSNDNGCRIRKTPTDYSKIKEYSKRRNPLNHPTVMFRKSDILSVGGYRDLRKIQDYDLWMRLLNEGHKITNIPEILVITERSGIEKRRGGLEYAKIETQLQYEFYENGYISILDLFRNLSLRLPVRILPNKARKIIYDNFARRGRE